MRNPFRRRPIEERQGYQEILLAGIEALVAGATANANANSAVAAAATLWSRTLMAAGIEGPGSITPHVLRQIGRDLILRGQSVWLIAGAEGNELRQASHVTVERDYRYKVTVERPGRGSQEHDVMADGVLHFRWDTDTHQPWYGISPVAGLKAAKALSNMELRLSEELGAIAAYVVPVPQSGTSAAATQLRTDLRSAKGGLYLAESTQTAWGEDDQARPAGDYDQKRLGAMIPETHVPLHKALYEAVISACGVPVSLGGSTGSRDGTQLREDYRRFVMNVVEPVADGIEHEVSRKLGSLNLSFMRLWAHDVAGRAQVVERLVKAGVTVEVALRIAGLGNESA